MGAAAFLPERAAVCHPGRPAAAVARPWRPHLALAARDPGFHPPAYARLSGHVHGGGADPDPASGGRRRTAAAARQRRLHPCRSGAGRGAAGDGIPELRGAGVQAGAGVPAGRLRLAAGGLRRRPVARGAADSHGHRDPPGAGRAGRRRGARRHRRQRLRLAAGAAHHRDHQCARRLGTCWPGSAC